MWYGTRWFGTRWFARPYWGPTVVSGGVLKIWNGYEWVVIGPQLPVGGVVPQVLRKASSADYDVEWGVVAADEVTYDPAASGLAATDVQAAIDEMVAEVAEIATPVTQPNTFVEYGCTVSYDEALGGLNYNAGSGRVWIAGVPYLFDGGSAELSPADGTYDRYDIFVAKTDGTLFVVEGTAAASPLEPYVDPETQCRIGMVLVAAGLSAPVTTNTLIYAENAGTPTEWNASANGTGASVNSTVTPHAGTYCCQFNNSPKAAYVVFTPGSTLAPDPDGQLLLWVKPDVVFASKRYLVIQWFQAGAAKGLSLDLAKYGLVNSTLSWQLVTIPIVAFALPAGVLMGGLRITVSGGNLSAAVDDVSYNVAGVVTPPLGIEPSGTVVSETSYGQSASAGASALYSRGDHTHGTPAAGGPSNAHYLTDRAEAGLSDEVNLGALSTGVMKLTVAGSVATPSIAVGADLPLMTGDAGAGGAAGAVPAPGSGDAAAGKYLGAGGTWGVPSGTGAPTNATYLTATAEAGLSAEVNLGALTTGILKVSVAAGVATPAIATGPDLPVMAGDAGAGGAIGAVPAPAAGDAAAGKYLKADATWAAPGGSATVIHAISATFDGAGAALVVGSKVRIRVPYTCTIKSVSMGADVSGSAVVDIWKDTHANYPPTVADTLIGGGGTKPTIGATDHSEDTTLTAWTTAITAGDWLVFNVDSCTTITWLTVILKVEA